MIWWRRSLRNTSIGHSLAAPVCTRGTTKPPPRCKRKHGSKTRGLYFVADKASTSESAIEPSRLPWELYLAKGAENAAEWNLPEAATSPLFGLPSLPPLDLPERPFRHLRWFGREHAELFFGRGNEIRSLYQQVTASDSAPIILFYGQSGVGKIIHARRRLAAAIGPNARRPLRTSRCSTRSLRDSRICIGIRLRSVGRLVFGRGQSLAKMAQRGAEGKAARRDSRPSGRGVYATFGQRAGRTRDICRTTEKRSSGTVPSVPPDGSSLAFVRNGLPKSTGC